MVLLAASCKVTLVGGDGVCSSLNVGAVLNECIMANLMPMAVL